MTTLRAGATPTTPPLHTPNERGSLRAFLLLILCAYLNWKFAACVVPSLSCNATCPQVFFHAELVFHV